MKTLFLIFLAAFIVQFSDGTVFPVPGAVGFVLIEVEKTPCHGFFDRNGKPIIAIPSAIIQGAKFVPDERLM